MKLFFFLCGTRPLSWRELWPDVDAGCSPNHQRWHGKVEAQFEYVNIACMFLHVWHRFVHAQSVLINKISASELRQKFIKRALLVGQDVQGEEKVDPSSCMLKEKKENPASHPLGGGRHVGHLRWLGEGEEEEEVKGEMHIFLWKPHLEREKNHTTMSHIFCLF